MSVARRVVTTDALAFATIYPSRVVGQTCFCGCGKPLAIYRRERRANNARGEAVQDLLRRVEEQPPTGAGSARLADWRAQGETLLDRLMDVNHGSRDPWSIDPGEVVRWLATGESIARGMRAKGA